MILEIIFWALLIDSLIANYVSWSSSREYFNKMKFFRNYMPITKGWTIFYLILSIFIGYLIYFN